LLSGVGYTVAVSVRPNFFKFRIVFNLFADDIEMNNTLPVLVCNFF